MTHPSRLASLAPQGEEMTTASPNSCERLFTLAELFHGLVRQVVLAEAEGCHQRQMLRRSDEGFELFVEGVVEVLVFLAEAEAAVTLHRFAGNLAKGRRRFDTFALLGHVGDRERGQG